MPYEEHELVGVRQPIDYNQLILWHLNRINQMLCKEGLDPYQLYAAVGFLESMLDPFMLPEISEQLDNINKKYEAKCEAENWVWKRVYRYYWTWSQEKHRVLLELMNKKGMLIEETERDSTERDIE